MDIEDKKTEGEPQESEFDLVIGEEESDVDSPPKDDPDKDAVNDDTDDSDDEDDEDERLGEGRDEESEEDKKARRKEERRQRRENRQRYREADQELIAQLSEQNRLMAERLGGIESQMAQGNVQQIASAAEHWQRRVQQIVQAKARAVANGDGEALAALEMKQIEAQQNAQHFQGLHQRAQAEVQQRQQQPKQTATPVGVQKNRTTFMARNPWFNPSAGDERARRVLEIDHAVANAGYDPQGTEYWFELERRIEAAGLKPKPQQPGRQAVSDDDKGGRRGPPVARAGTSPNRTQVRIPPELKQALVESGMWDDVKKRDEIVREHLATKKRLGLK